MSNAQASTVDDLDGGTADSTQLPTSHRWWILVLVQVSTLTFGIAVTSTTVVVPQIRGALSLTHDEGAWIITLFLAAAAVATPLTGWLAGKFGWRRFMVATLAGFTLSSLVCGLADSLEVLLLARVAQGLFGAPLMPMGQGMLLATFPRHMHPLVLMLWGTGAVTSGRAHRVVYRYGRIDPTRRGDGRPAVAGGTPALPRDYSRTHEPIRRHGGE